MRGRLWPLQRGQRTSPGQRGSRPEGPAFSCEGPERPSQLSQTIVARECFAVRAAAIFGQNQTSRFSLSRVELSHSDERVRFGLPSALHALDVLGAVVVRGGDRALAFDGRGWGRGSILWLNNALTKFADFRSYRPGVSVAFRRGRSPTGTATHRKPDSSGVRWWAV